MFYQTIFSFLLISLLCSCNNTATTTDTTIETDKTTATTPKIPDHKNDNEFVAQIEAAHQRAAFLAKKAIQFDIVLSFGGKERMNGTITTLTNSSKGVITYKDGRKVYYDQDKVYCAAEVENPARVRFSAYTWPYFFLFPYKLSDPGTHWNAYDNNMLRDKEYLTQKLTFAPGTGDDPKDWYIAYADKETQLINVAAYIVTAGGSTREEAEQDPHAIEYKNYTTIDGVPIAQNWVFWGWKKEQGLTDELGNASLSNIKFIDVTEEDFIAPDNFKTI